MVRFEIGMTERSSNHPFFAESARVLASEVQGPLFARDIPLGPNPWTPFTLLSEWAQKCGTASRIKSSTG
jgi:hypothetical protein